MANLIELECDGLHIRLSRWSEAVAQAATDGVQFSSREVMIGFLDDAFPDWRQHATFPPVYNWEK